MKFTSTNRSARIALALCATLAASTSANALSFVFTYDPSIDAEFGVNAAAVKADMVAVGNLYSASYSNNVTLNFTIKADTAPGTLASSLSEYDQSHVYTYTEIRDAMIAHASTAASAAATNALPLTQPDSTKSGYVLNNAEAKALGLISGSGTALDGVMNIGTNIGGGANWQFDGTAIPAADDYSLFDATEHEFTELMGRTTQFGNAGWPWNTPIDLLRYSAPGVIDMSPTDTGSYFSIDGGVTVTKAYNFSPDGGDRQDWASSGSPDPYDAFATPGAFLTQHAYDDQIMNVLGWTQSSTGAVPEPETWALMMVGFSALGVAMRSRRRNAVAVAVA